MHQAQVSLAGIHMLVTRIHVGEISRGETPPATDTCRNANPKVTTGNARKIRKEWNRSILAMQTTQWLKQVDNLPDPNVSPTFEKMCSFNFTWGNPKIQSTAIVITKITETIFDLASSQQVMY